MFDYLLVWKRELLDLLDTGFLAAWDWKAFIAEAEACGCLAMADDMRKRFDYYKTKEQKCTAK